jgi:hypothetical protein
LSDGHPTAAKQPSASRTNKRSALILSKLENEFFDHERAVMHVSPGAGSIAPTQTSTSNGASCWGWARWGSAR